MIKLFILNFSLIATIILALFTLKKTVKSSRGIKILFIVAPLLTIICHYSSLIYNEISEEGGALLFLKSNPNLILPIYPCNVVMWCCLIFGLQNKENKFRHFLIDYIFLFGIISALVGLFANVDFIRNPSLKDYDVTKGILAHGFMLFNVLLFPTFGEFKLDLNRNIPYIFISVIMMFVVGMYCNLVFTVLSGKDAAYSVNSMFIIHSPFDGVDFLTYPIIALVAIVAYFFIIWFAELFKYGKENIWYKRFSQLKKGESDNENTI